MSREKWDERLNKLRPIFDVAGFALTTVTWTSLCVVVSFIVVQGYWTPSPALEQQGLFGTGVYVVLAGSFVLVAVVSSVVLVLALWSLVVHLKRDVEYGTNGVAAVLVTLLGWLWHMAFAGFLFILVAILSTQVLIALGRMKSF